MKKIICLFFGHKESEDPFFYNNNIDMCDRCEEGRSPAYGTEPYFTALEWFGLLRYPLFRLYIWFSNLHYRAQDKAKKTRTEDDSVPF